MPPAPGPAEGAPLDDGELGDVPAERESLLRRIPSLMAGDPTKPFTKKEADELYDELLETFQAYCETLDYLVSRTNRAHAECEVWQELEEDELGVFVDLAIYRAQKSARVAAAVRQMIATRLYLQAGMITLDRAAATFEFYKQNGGLLLWFPAMPMPFRSA